MDIKKYSHRIKVFHDRWLKKPKEVEITLPYVPQEFTRPDEVVESFHIDWEDEEKGQQKVALVKQAGYGEYHLCILLNSNKLFTFLGQ